MSRQYSLANPYTCLPFIITTQVDNLCCPVLEPLTENQYRNPALSQIVQEQNTVGMNQRFLLHSVFKVVAYSQDLISVAHELTELSANMIRQSHPLNTTKQRAGDCSDSIVIPLNELVNKIISSPGGTKHTRVQHGCVTLGLLPKMDEFRLDLEPRLYPKCILFIWLKFPPLPGVATTAAQAEKAHWKCGKYCCYPDTMTHLAS